MRRFILSVALVCTAVFPAAANEILKIGVIGPMSGPAANWGLELTRGAEMKAEEINVAGGLKVGDQTYDIQIVSYDHKANAAEAITVTNKLVFEDKVKFIVGNAIGATTSAAQTITEPNKVIFMFGSYGKQALGPQFPYSYRFDLSDVEVVEPFYRWLKEQRHIKNVAFLNVNDQSGKGAGAQMVEVANSLGFTIVAEEYFDRGQKDFYPLLTRVLAANPDYIDVGVSPPGTAGLILKQLKEMGYSGVKGWISGINLETAVKISGPEAAEGTLSPWSSNFDGQETPMPVKKLAATYLRKYGEPTGTYTIANYVALDVLTRAIQAAGTLDSDKIVAELTNKKFDTAWGPIVVGGQSTYGVNHQFLRPLTITQLHDGHAVDVGSTMPRDLAGR
jgi:branched-chain amino acid transport system substrate-binding protein